MIHSPNNGNIEMRTLLNFCYSTLFYVGSAALMVAFFGWLTFQGVIVMAHNI